MIGVFKIPQGASMSTLKYASKQQMSHWRQHLHQHPETGFEVHDTAAFVAQKLTEFGLQVHTQIGEIGVVGVLKRGTSDKAIGLRADMDALAIQELNDFTYKSQNEGRMHACGHDGHTAMLLSAARHLAATKNFDGILHLVFQPAEEGLAGARCEGCDARVSQRIGSATEPQNIPYDCFATSGLPGV